MSLELRNRIYGELSQLTLIDPHTHINPHSPASESLADVLGYHYYTELAHSAGMPREDIEDPDLAPRDKVWRLMQRLAPIDNTIQYSWLVEMCREFFGFEGERLTAENWEAVYDAASQKMAASDWADQVLRQSKLEAVFLTNDFDDPLDGFDTQVYIPCLRTDDLVFHLAQDTVRGRLERATNISVSNAADLRRAIRALFVHFRRNNAKACAISLPPDFAPNRVSDGRADAAIAALWKDGLNAGEAHRRAAANWVFWTLAEHCEEFGLPFDLMIGVNRNVYEAGVHQGRDLYDSRTSLIQYRELFNAFPRVVFPVSVLTSAANQELASYAWIFPNVVTSGHWWYSNTPSFIEHDAAARLEAVPRTKQIAYYSDMYKLEFALPKFNMYKRILAKVLAERYVLDRGWSEERAVDLGRQVLRTNVEEVFRFHEPAPTLPEEPTLSRSAAFVGTLAEKVQPPTEELPAMREFTYWPQSTSEEDLEAYSLEGGSDEQQAELPVEATPQTAAEPSFDLADEGEEAEINLLEDETFDLTAETPEMAEDEEFPTAKTEPMEFSLTPEPAEESPEPAEEPVEAAAAETAPQAEFIPDLEEVSLAAEVEDQESYAVSDEDLLPEEEPLTLDLDEDEITPADDERRD